MSRTFYCIRFSSKKEQKGESFRRPFEFAIEVCRENGGVLADALTLNDLGVSAFRGTNAKVGALADFLKAIRIGRVLKGPISVKSRPRFAFRETPDSTEPRSRFG